MKEFTVFYLFTQGFLSEASFFEAREEKP